MRILLTNDDGIDAPGIHALKQYLYPLGHITMVAPDRERSATGHGITIHKPLRVNEMKYNDCLAYSVTGTPADCVKLAIHGLMPVLPDIVVAGINAGANLGTDVLYSGTVSGAIEGIIEGIPSIAVSLAIHELLNYDYAAQVTVAIVKQVIKNGLPKETILNINVPDIQSNKHASTEITRLGVRKYTNSIQKRIDPRGYEYYWLGGQVVDVDCDKNLEICTDINAIYNNKVSITPLHVDLTNYNLINELKGWNYTLNSF